MECTTKSIYESLNFCDGQTVLPGIKPKVYFLPKSKILSWPKLPQISEAEKMSDLAKLKGSFVLEADCKWRTLKALTTKSNATSETQGEYPSVTALNKATLKYPGTDEEAAGFARQAMSDDLVYLIQQRSGKFRVLGSESFETTTKPSLAMGEGNTGEAGTTLEIEATDICFAPFYEGKIETEDGNISGVDGSAWVEEKE